jgi:lysyl-tRNA synthetase, class II
LSGNVFRTRSGELTVNTHDYDVLCKSLRPLPDKHSGLKDSEMRYRHRSLDLIMNPEVKRNFIIRTKAIDAMRNFLNSEGYHEFETPLLQPIYGGANARPFVTRINALDVPAYLNISPELYLKRLIVGGLDKVYTICKNFRNEGVDRTHNPEFTMMECYAAYRDYNDMMKLTEEMYADIFNKVLGTIKVNYQGTEIDFSPPWERISMYDAVGRYAGIDAADISTDNDEDMDKGTLVQKLFEEHCEKHLIQPTFVIDHPKESTPLCKEHRDDPDLIERFEPFVYGVEIGNAYSELNDPLLQRYLLLDQEESRMLGDEEAHPLDEDFLTALEYGMPPTGGLGLGIDRMVMFMTDSRSIRDVILFPFMKPNQKDPEYSD